MPTTSEIVDEIASAATWDARIALIRRVPEAFGTSQHAEVYSAIAARVYAPSIEPDFAYVHWRDDYELGPLEAAYALAHSGTAGFSLVSRQDLTRLIASHPQTLRVFRLLLGLIQAEFSEACTMIADQFGLTRVSKSSVKALERGVRCTEERAATCATVIDLGMTGELFPPAPPGTALRRKTDKPDTSAGWESVREYAELGVPLPVFLHQRAYGGAFRQLLDATSSRRGDTIETAVEELFSNAKVPFIRTGSHNQAMIAARFGLTVRPAPDFVIYDPRVSALRAMLECKIANDGGTARDKASRFRSLRAEAQRLGGIPVIAVLGGIGWRRAADALGPVVRDSDGRTFTVATLGALLQVDPLPTLAGLGSGQLEFDQPDNDSETE